MRKNRIVFKLFIITTVLFVLLLSVQFIFQNTLISKFYKNIKINMLKQETETLINILEKSTAHEEEIYETLNRFSNKNNAAMALINRYGTPEYGLNFQYKSSILEIAGDDGNKFMIYIDTFLKNFIIHEKELEIGKTIEVVGEAELGNESNKYIFPYKIIIEGKEYENSIFEDIYIDTIDITELEENIGNYGNAEIITTYDIDITNIKGTISSLYIPDEKFYSNLYMEQMLDYNISNFIATKKNKDLFDVKELTYYEYIDESTGIRNVIFVKPIFIKSYGQYLLFTITSLQPIDDAIFIIKSYNKYLFFFAFILVVISSYIYSRVIARPLIRINKVAHSMANLDFSRECKISSKDEIGDLANSLNILSRNLKKSLTQLKETNKKLVNDIEFERRQEKTRKEFIANISHELKTPLTVISGIASGIRDGLYDKDNKIHVYSLIEEVDHMNELIFEMLELSKIESDGYKLNLEIFNISDVVLKVHSKLKTLIINKCIKVSFNIEDSFVKGDSKKIEQVISNLYSNAIRYSNIGESIFISTYMEEDNCLFTIENTGTYIPKNEIDDIWKPFYRIEKSRNRESGGTGLGLQIVKRILERHGSEFGVRNTDRGVKFYFTLIKEKQRKQEGD